MRRQGFGLRRRRFRPREAAFPARSTRVLILVPGGEDENRTYIENEAYDVKADRWFKLAPMPAGRHGHGVAAVGRSAYVVGGALQRGGRVSAQLLAFTLP
jgi:hypothetical protein